MDEPEVLGLVEQYLHRFVSDGGEYVDIEQGISLGCPLSPLMGALFLKPLDDRLAPLLGGVGGGLGCFYIRYVDDWVILAPTRWKLRKAIKAVNEEMAALQVEKHPDKTFIGRVGRGFEFLGYWFSSQGLSVARKTVERMVEKVRRLYELGASDERILSYLLHWGRWVRCGLFGVFLVGEQPGCEIMLLPRF
ncbi:MAG: hypothetical protein F6K14_33510 [Symploca sp. SIO2C1]|nr:hypothetical protein [Symploca sp. SIO2C1]